LLIFAYICFLENSVELAGSAGGGWAGGGGGGGGGDDGGEGCDGEGSNEDEVV